MNDRCGCVRAHGYDLTGKMTGGGLRSVAWASAITLDSTSVIALQARGKIAQELSEDRVIRYMARAGETRVRSVMKYDETG